jgi:uncharacterized cupin superfamily protein
MRIIVEMGSRHGDVRADRAWEFFFGRRRNLVPGSGLHGFANWLWDELSKVAGALYADAKDEVTVSVPSLRPDALDLVVRLLSFWTTEVRVRRGRSLSANRWTAPVINLLKDRDRGPAARGLMRAADDAGSSELNLMPLLGAGRAFYSLQVIARGECTARLHSHSAVDEYYLILDGRGTLRFNGRAVPVERGDLIGKPTGPDAASHLLADRGVPLRILDMELWHERFSSTSTTAKDLVVNPDFDELMIRGPGWSGFVPRASVLAAAAEERHYDEGYRRGKDGSWTPATVPGLHKVRGRRARD